MRVIKKQKYWEIFIIINYQLINITNCCDTYFKTYQEIRKRKSVEIFLGLSLEPIPEIFDFAIIMEEKKFLKIYFIRISWKTFYITYALLENF